MRIFIAASIALMMLFGCASYPSVARYESILNTWVGHSETELIGSWGQPNGIYQSGIYQYLTYSGGRNLYYMNGYVLPVGCTTTFTVSNGVILTWGFEGNACKSY